MSAAARPELGEPTSVVPIERSLQRAVDEAEAALARGEHVEHDEVMPKLRRWLGQESWAEL